MRSEFDRFGQSRFRVLTGVLEILGGLGNIVGLWIPLIGVLSALGLGVLMAMGTFVRFKVGDSVTQAFPALSFMALNFLLVILQLGRI